jgi:hypothetical protein
MQVHKKQVKNSHHEIPPIYSGMIVQIFTYPINRAIEVKFGASGSVVVKALCYQLEGRGFETR